MQKLHANEERAERERTRESDKAEGVNKQRVRRELPASTEPEKGGGESTNEIYYVSVL